MPLFDLPQFALWFTVIPCFIPDSEENIVFHNLKQLYFNC